MCDIYGFILRNKMIINNIVNGNQNIDEKNINVRIAQMRTYVTHTEKTFKCHHSRQKKLLEFAASTTKRQLEILREAGVLIHKAHAHGGALH